MKRKTTVRELHLNTSDIVKQVANGETFVVERRGVAVAEIRPFAGNATRRLPDREKFVKTLRRVKTDSGRMLEQDRT